jgi:hypothetical protein
VSSEDIQSWLFTEAVPLRGKGTPFKGQFQSIPQYIEVPPNIEVKPIVSYFSTVLSY